MEEELLGVANIITLLSIIEQNTCWPLNFRLFFAVMLRFYRIHRLQSDMVLYLSTYLHTPQYSTNVLHSRKSLTRSEVIALVPIGGVHKRHQDSNSARQVGRESSTYYRDEELQMDCLEIFASMLPYCISSENSVVLIPHAT